MKVHYINILMLADPLNILVYNQRNHKTITHHTPNESPIKTHRSLCECELYVPQNYDNDPEMKSVMKNFDRQTSERLREYDERMNKNRKKCKDQCDKDIQKIILKDKIEKELKEKLATLETNINTKDLPICECEKSLTDKVEKGCLGCGLLGSGIAPNVGLFGEVALGAWKTAALVTAKKLAAEAGAAAGLKAGDALGMEIVTLGLKSLKVDTLKSGIFKSFVTTSRYTEVTGLVNIIDTQINDACSPFSIVKEAICALRENFGLEAVPGGRQVEQIDVIRRVLNEALKKATSSANAKATQVAATKTAAFETAQKGAIEAASTQFYTTIAYSITAILIIVLIMVIIYLILRYRRKKKMKKKLQYIKLLEK
ncbi:hypothetical protein PFUGPA_01201 [Plasmodium falciparum Palo Alto/Uganda]|uniref:Rifin n=2 Tax=Plasmodium falciparum TaxID=5833 RepID=W4J488_PLAFP|nr:hypothetical protein PFUGPA_01201 [Plasmodium falciparum Palo Alto/Uganda]ETW61559.1 hypothetical protein PFMC_02650 [Plasmodium falciparum CAMP/Malaysia]